MKKVLIFILTILLLTFTGCTDKTTAERNWKEDFTVTYKHVEADEFNIDAILSGTYVYEHDEYTLKNNTNEIFERVYLVFELDAVGADPIEYKNIVSGGLKQGETKVESITMALFELQMDEANIDYSAGYEITLIRIEYEIKETA